MAAPKLNPAQQAAVKAEIAARYCRGEYQSAIAAAVNLSQQQVSYYLQQLQGEWLTRAAATMDTAKAAELAKLDELERTYWAAWAASTQPQKRTKTADRAGVKSAEVGSQTRDGNPAFLAGVLACLERRCKMLGIDAPERKDVTSNGETLKIYAGFDPEAV